MPSGPRMRRFEATFSTSAWPRPRWVTGRAFAAAARTAAAARAITSRAKSASKTSRLIPCSASSRSAEKSQTGASCWCSVWTATRSRVGAGGLGQRLAELDLPVVADPDPVDGAEHDRPPLADQDDPPAAERMRPPPWSGRRPAGCRPAARRRRRTRRPSAARRGPLPRPRRGTGSGRSESRIGTYQGPPHGCCPGPDSTRAHREGSGLGPAELIPARRRLSCGTIEALRSGVAGDETTGEARLTERRGTHPCPMNRGGEWRW